MLAHLTVMSWQRNALINASIPFRPAAPDPPSYGKSTRWSVAFRDDHEADEWYSVRPLLVRLTDVVMDAETNVKLKQAALDLLGALCKDNEDISGEAMHLLDVDEGELRTSIRTRAYRLIIWPDVERDYLAKESDMWKSVKSSESSAHARKTVAPVFDELVGSRSNGIAVSAACWSVSCGESRCDRSY